MTLNPDHAALLEAAAIRPEVAGAVARSEPGCLVFRHEGYGGRVLEQRRPDDPEPGGPKYLTAAGEPLLLPVHPAMRERVADPTQTLVICEGSKGYLAATSWAPDGYAVVGILGCYGYRVAASGGVVECLYEIPLSGRDVVVLFDADRASNPSVYEAARDLASRLEVRGARSVRFANVPGGGKDSIDDYLATVPEKYRGDDLGRLWSQAGPLGKPPARARRVDPGKYRAGQDGQGRPFIVPKDRANVALYEAQSKRWAAATAGLSGTALEDWWSGVWGSTMDLPHEDLTTRVVNTGEAVYVDLCTPDGRALEVTGSGWRMLDRSPVTFARSGILAPMPDPAPGAATWADLWDLVNVAPEYRDLCRGWLLSAIHAGAPTPVLLMAGAQGAAKTSGMEYLGGLVDPVTIPGGSSEPETRKAWAALASQSRVVRMDNVSRVPAWWSDLMCTTVTGGVEASRALYTDSDLHAVRLYAAIILNGITLAGINRADLAERTVALEMHKPERYRPKDEVTAAYEAARPGLLALILNDLVTVLADTEPTPEVAGFRMVNFAGLLARLDRNTGTGALEAYRAAMDRHQDETLAADPFATAITRLLDTSPGGTWEGTANDLLEALEPVRGQMHKSRDYNMLRGQWPENAWAAGHWLTRSAGLLANVGIQVTRDRSRYKGRRLRLERRDVSPGENVPAPGQNVPAPEPEPQARAQAAAGRDVSGPGRDVSKPKTSRPTGPDSPTKTAGRDVQDVQDVCNFQASTQEVHKTPAAAGCAIPEVSAPKTSRTSRARKYAPPPGWKPGTREAM